MIQSKYIAKIVGQDLLSNLEKKYSINPFISSSFLHAFSDETKSPVHIVIYCNDMIIGFISGIEVKSRHRLLKDISKVYHFFSGPFVIDDHCLTVSECIKSILNLSLQQGAQKAYFKSYCFHTNFSCSSLNCFYKKFRSEFIIDLRCTIDHAWKRIKRNPKSLIKKLESMNVIFSENNVSSAIFDLDHGFDSVKERKDLKGHDVKYNPYYMDFLDNNVMINLLENKIAHVYQIIYEGEILCSSFVIENNGYAYALFASSSKNGYKYGASAALHWELIKKYISEGIKYLNLGGLPDDSSKWGIRRFKKSMGAEEKLCVGGVSDRIQPSAYCFLFNAYKKAMCWR